MFYERYHRALSSLDSSSSSFPSDYQGRTTLEPSIAQFRLEDHQEVVFWANSSSEVESSSSCQVADRAESDLRQYEDMLVECERLLETQPDSYQLWYDRGDALANLGHCDVALVSFDRVIALNPNFYPAWVFRGVMLIQLKRYEEALASCERALEIQPEDKEAWLFKGVALRYLGRWQQAYTSYDKALGIERLTLKQRLAQNWQQFVQVVNSIQIVRSRS